MYKRQEILRLKGPVLHYLGRELDKVPGHIRAAERCIPSLGEHAVKRMSELVQEGAEFIVGKQRRSRLRRFREIGDNAYQRTFLNAVPDALAAELRHPCTAPLGGAREEVCIKQCQMASISILHIIHLHILVIYRNILPFLE